MTSEVFIKFLGRPLKDAGKKVFLIVDNLKVHHSIRVSEWLAEEVGVPRQSRGFTFLN